MAIIAGVALPGEMPAMELTCAGCVQSCCEWSHAAMGNDRMHRFVRLHSKIPVPCAGMAAEYGRASSEFNLCSGAANMRCLRRNCFRCVYTFSFWIPLPNVMVEGKKLPGQFGASGTKPARFTPRQTALVEPKQKRGQP